MSHERTAWLTVAAALAIVSLIPRAVATQTRQPSRTPWGDPDLQGIWNFATLTPLERPQKLGDKEVLTPEEAADFEKETLQDRYRELSTGDREWWDPGTKVMAARRTSLIVDPPSGRVPPLTAEGRRRAEERAAARRGRGPADSWEDRSLSERCIWFGSAGPPIIPGPYNNDIHVVQTPDYVAILNEMIHDVRIVPLHARTALTSHIPQWMGDSHGHWDGDTLVIETTNFPDERAFRGAGRNLRVIERLSRVDRDTIAYRFTVTDPTTWTAPWTAEFSMTKTPGPLYEFACHEGNYLSMAGTLGGARVEESKK